MNVKLYTLYIYKYFKCSLIFLNQIQMTYYSLKLLDYLPSCKTVSLNFGKQLVVSFNNILPKRHLCVYYCL